MATNDEKNVRKAEVVHVCDGGDRRAIECDVAEMSLMERLVTIPVHGKHRGITLRGIQ